MRQVRPSLLECQPNRTHTILARKFITVRKRSHLCASVFESFTVLVSADLLPHGALLMDLEVGTAERVRSVWLTPLCVGSVQDRPRVPTSVVSSARRPSVIGSVRRARSARGHPHTSRRRARSSPQTSFCGWLGTAGSLSSPDLPRVGIRNRSRVPPSEADSTGRARSVR